MNGLFKICKNNGLNKLIQERKITMLFGLIAAASATQFLEGAAAAIALYVAIKPTVKPPRTKKYKEGKS